MRGKGRDDEGMVERTSQAGVSERTAEEESRGKRAWFQADGLRPE